MYMNKAARFGFPTGKAESGTEEEFNWAIEGHRLTGFPEIKWFFRRVERFIAPPDPGEIEYALSNGRRCELFGSDCRSSIPRCFTLSSQMSRDFATSLKMTSPIGWRIRTGHGSAICHHETTSFRLHSHRRQSITDGSRATSAARHCGN
jgi:hypothetical protein